MGSFQVMNDYWQSLTSDDQNKQERHMVYNL